MRKVEFKLSPEAFCRLRDALYAAERERHNPDAAAQAACAAIGYFPKPFTETVLVVDYGLSGPAAPFREVA